MAAARAQNDEQKREAARAAATEALFHDEERCIFATYATPGTTSEDQMLYVNYVLQDEGKVMDMVHTFVPPAGRGKGLAGIVCEAAFAHCRKNGLKAKPSCTYISGRFLQKNPQYNDLVV